MTTEPDSDVVVGFYCLSSMSVSRKSVSDDQQGSDPPPSLPAVLLGKLAVISQLQTNSGLGTSLMRDAIVRTITTSLNVGVRLMVVDALTQRLVGWYERFGFEQTHSDPLRLVAIAPSLRLTYLESGGVTPAI